MPAQLVQPLWLAAALAVGAVTATSWRIAAPWSIRVSGLLLATMLASPHVLVYDGVLLAPAVLWLADRARRDKDIAVLVALGCLSVALVLPAARVGGVPIALPLLGWLWWRCRTGDQASSPDG
jgi:hypothetical protein